MIKKILGWNENETKDFLNFVFQNKDKSFLWIFENWATISSRQPFSVRNYFYKLCKMLKENPILSKKMQISDENLQNLFSKRFAEDEEVVLLENILPLENQKSVRKACLNLSDGDAFKMVRFQNKYRHLLKTKKALVLQVKNRLDAEGFVTRNPYPKQNIVPINSQELSDGDIQSLFMGIVKMVKNDVSEKYDLKMKNEKQILHSQLKQTVANLRRKEIQFEELLEENQKLKIQFDVVSKNYENEREQNVEHLKQVKDFVDSKNMLKLKEFLNKLNIDADENKQTL